MAPRYIPKLGTAPNVPRDAKETYITLKRGGVVIIPTDVGYALLTST
jgi:tRNA A37 threonylcarbamoyladenosine synthetase subunit TsaC/SUA5/YrdC